METVNELNLTFQIYMQKIKLGLNYLNKDDKLNVVKWIKKIREMGSSFDELKLRNDLAFYLNTQIYDKQLKPPFNQSPPFGRISKSITLQIPSLSTSNQENQSGAQIDQKVQKQPEIFVRSPDKGEFLIGQPVPKCGAFCYLAVVSRQPDNS